MPRLILLLFTALLLALAGCNSTRSRPLVTPNASTLDPKTHAKITRGLIEPGFTPEMVYLALGKPTEPKDNLVDSTRDGTWVYQDFRGADRELVRAGFRRHVVFDPSHKTDKVVTEPVDPKALASLPARSLHITFRDGRVVDIQRAAEL